VLVLDPSALLRRYIEEEGTHEVLDLMERDTEWVASAIARTETEIAVCRVPVEPDIAALILERVRTDWERFFVIPVDSACLRDATTIGCDHEIRTLDAIHLAAARRLPGSPRFVTFDHRQAKAARLMGLQVSGRVTPTTRSRRREPSEA
jgi:predicted nucleic acid-binding protein